MWRPADSTSRRLHNIRLAAATFRSADRRRAYLCPGAAKRIAPDTPSRRMWTLTRNAGLVTLGTIAGTTTWTIHGNMGAFPGPSAPVTYGDLAAADPGVSGLTASTSAWRRPTWPTATDGCGTRTTSFCMTILTIQVGIWRTIRASAPMCT